MSMIARVLLPLLLTAQVASAWDLGDLASHSARVDIDWSSQLAWADAYDTQAELEALGWTVVNVNANDCAADTSAPKNEDASVFTIGGTYFNATNCPAGVCNKIFRLEDNCQYDLLVGTGGTDGVGGTPEVILDYNNYAIVGGGMTGATATYIAFNDEVPNGDTVVDLGFGNSSAWGATGGSNGSTYTWSSGTAKGTSTIVLSSCVGLVANDPILLEATDADGFGMRWMTRATTVDGSCNLTLEDPLPMVFTTPIQVTELPSGRRKKNIWLDLHVGFPLIPAGTCDTDAASSEYCAVPFRIHAGEQVLFDRVWIGPYGQTGIDTRNTWKIVVRNGIGGDGQTSKTRGNRTHFITDNEDGSGIAVYNNWFKPGAIRNIYVNSNASLFQYNGFNYWADMNCSFGERAAFLNHTASAVKMSAFLIENNDMECPLLNESINTIGRYGTFFRNRSDRDTGSTTYNSTSASRYQNWFANRFTTWSMGSNQPNALGRYNVAESGTITAPGGAGVDWGATNQVTTGANSNCPLNLPASLAFRTDTAPTWWCTESGSWTAWTMGACDTGTSDVKLPAQIRAEAGTCTAVTTNTGSLSGGSLSGGKIQ